MRLHCEIVEVGNALHRGLGIVATVGVLVVKSASKILLIAECNFFQLDFHALLRLVQSRCGAAAAELLTGAL